MNGISLAIDAVGSQAELARRLGTTLMRVGNWKRRGVPADQVIPICRATGGHVYPYQLRPDIYPDPDWFPPAASEHAESA